MPYVAPSTGVPLVSFQEGRRGEGHQCLMPPPSLTHPMCLRKWVPVHLSQPERFLALRGQSPHPPDNAGGWVLGLAHARLPAPSPPPAHPDRLRPVLPAPGGGLSARAASLNTSTRSQSSARMVGARTRPRPAAGRGPEQGRGRAQAVQSRRLARRGVGGEEAAERRARRGGGRGAGAGRRRASRAAASRSADGEGGGAGGARRLPSAPRV